ncbi:Na+/H+ antiporter Mnh2 subunit D [Staphylococcus saccharolyticus]|uniref:Monovalent cation/H+ antiporter subunit D n=1 Tax=Staphylococcus saccharolyticus TaxID=33028 RepID=A0A380HAC7_9STAP|nr:Na+/H+ antiporter Mnh2 subunit D [Staphylococcus saccharolyticus]MBL7565828.1 Na+/H+ antiporter Mnh2 subunit D [Staphylococcus saccharolyticus]MBL7572090.1 Na+/H+ antiporter Mnh2 subunit D [Staphylococcus saccharolyticus]QQB99342.1 Na+/H+ antiporter Mnh2 subunit D [Staphylococcus saccharolyticus]QRJ67533.1 Na+/H+ antiporter Mnh2 subunit D [Staphylococcus saccharolyticus]RTX94782.1 Na+/H+ antiporter subunit D [Staphylococcus saccharolyticus]
MTSNLLILPMLLPFICALILVFTKNKNQIFKILSITTMIMTTLISLALLIYVMNHKPITLNFGGWKAPYGIQFLGDSLSLLMVTVSSFVVTLIMAYGFGRGEKRVNRFHLPTFILLLTVGVIGSFLTSDLFNLYVMFEIILLASFVLVTLGQSVEQLRAAIIYVVLNIIGSWLFLLGIGMLYKTVGTLNFSHLAMRLNHMENNQTITLISLVFLVAFSSKAALVIFMWLPKAYAVLNTELAALFAALMTKVGAYAMIRFFTLLFDQHTNVTHTLLVFMACLTMIIGAFGVIAYKDIKKIVAYQVILSIGFIIFGLGSNTFSGVDGAIFYLSNDIIVKTLLFFIVGSLVYMSGYRNYQYLSGLAKKEPFFGVAFIVMIFAIGGIPPFSGFPGKVLIFQGAIRNGNYIGLALMIVTSLIAMYSLFRVMFIMYFGDADGEQVKFNKLPSHRKGLLGILVVVVFAMGIAAPVVLKVTDNATELNMKEHVFQENVSPHLKEVDH